MDPVDMAINQLRQAGHKVERVWKFGAIFPSLVYVDGQELTERQAIHLASQNSNAH